MQTPAKRAVFSFAARAGYYEIYYIGRYKFYYVGCYKFYYVGYYELYYMDTRENNPRGKRKIRRGWQENHPNPLEKARRVVLG